MLQQRMRMVGLSRRRVRPPTSLWELRRRTEHQVQPLLIVARLYATYHHTDERITTLRRLRRPLGLDAEERRGEATLKLARRLEPKARTELSDETVWLLSQLFEPLNEVLREGPVPFPDLRGEQIASNLLERTGDELDSSDVITVLDDMRWASEYVPKGIRWRDVRAAALQRLRTRLGGRLLDLLRRWEREGLLIEPQRRLEQRRLESARRPHVDAQGIVRPPGHRSQSPAN